MNDDETLDPLPPELAEALEEALAAPLGERDERCDALVREHPQFETQIRSRIQQQLLETFAQVDAVAREENPDELPGRIGRYEVLGFLGRGGMGNVYLAQQEQPIRREVAIKVMRSDLGNRTSRLRYELECRTLAKLQHPSIARIYDAGVTENGAPFVVMERIEGPDIVRYSDTHALGLEQRIELFQAVCAALSYAHEKGIVHRDIKPSNVLVRTVNGRPLPVLLDFGLALVRDGGPQSELDESGRALGTAGYMSPEQCRGAVDEIDTRSDVYSLGVLLYQLLTGETPFDGRELRRLGWEAMAKRILEDDPLLPSMRIDPESADSVSSASARGTRPGKLKSRLRGDLDWITLRAMHKDRRTRYASPLDLAEDLHRHLRKEPVEAGPPSRSYRLRKYLARNRALLGVAGTIILLLSAGLFFVNEQRARTQQALEQVSKTEQELRTALGRYWRSFDVRAARDLIRQANEELWPLEPQLVPRIDAWTKAADDLESRRAAHTSWIRAKEASPNDLSREDETELALARETLKILADWKTPRTGLRTRLANRRELSESLWRRSIGDAREAWEACRKRIRASERYGDLDLKPQLGLIPIGPDPQSGLEEFVHVLSGRTPDRDENGAIDLRANTGIVLVLIPAGRYRIGATKPPGPGEHLDTLADDDESPDHAVHLSAYFIGKFEVTKAQWLRIGGGSKAFFSAGFNLRTSNDKKFPYVNGVHPEESITYLAGREALERFSLRLPTEARWEAAARAGCSSPWPDGVESGHDPRLGALVNIADESWARERAKDGVQMPSFANDDSYIQICMVHRLPPNPFGLYNMMGNVAEWCEDYILEYGEAAARAGDGLRIGKPEKWERVIRGPHFESTPKYARHSYRNHGAPGNRSSRIGIRASRDLDQ